MYQDIKSQNLTVDLRRIYLTTRDLTSWSQPYRDDKCTKQLYPVWILPVNYKRIMNRHARKIDHVLTASWRSRPTWSELLPVAWDFDSPWITGTMTAHQSVAYVRHIILAPAANLCTLSAIVFLPIKAWICRHICRYIDGSAILLTVNRPVWPRWLKISPCVTTKIMWNETAFWWNHISLWQYQTIYSKHSICSYEFLLRFHDSFAGRLRNQIRTTWLWKFDT